MQTNVIIRSIIQTEFVADCTLKVNKCVLVRVARFISYCYLIAFEADLRTRKSTFRQNFQKEESPIYHYAREDVRSA